MTRDQAKDYINSNPQEHLQRARKNVNGQPSYICPLCGNGSGSSGDGLATKDGKHYHCFKCGFSGDMVELIAKENGIENGGSKEAFEAARAAYGLTVDSTEYTHKTDTAHNTAAGDRKKTEEAKHKDMRDILREYCKPGCDTSYLQARGISKSTAERLRFGYDPGEKAVVIPVSKGKEWYYIKRFTEERRDSNGDLVRYQIPAGAKIGLFNAAALQQEEPVFITEGAINAASIIEAGGQAVAINSAANAGGFAASIPLDIKCRKFVICMDNDEAGEKASETLMGHLEDCDCKAVNFPVPAPYNDANEALCGDRAAFEAYVLEAKNSFFKNEIAKIERHKVGAMLSGFWDYVHDDKNNKPIKTGFFYFDTSIGGGLLPKLYIIGAITSLGKTAFVMQMVDQIAERGTDVLIFSLEMSKEDIMARSISRHTYLLASQPAGTKGNRFAGNMSLAKTELGVVMGSRYNQYSKDELDIIQQAIANYRAYAADHISIYEGKHTADEIRAKVEQYISITGRIPVVVVDYLQILQPPQSLTKATIREQTDYNIEVLTAMRRELKTPVIGISSFNRGSYTTVADSSSFKESGGIEYSGDCLITLELDFERADRGSDSSKDNKNKDRIKEAMRADPREIKLTFQKNRGNKVGTTICYKYKTKFNYFEEDLKNIENKL